MSHTTTVKVAIRDKEAFGRAVQSRGGQVLGEGTHRIYSGSFTGYGVQLPGWSYPIIATANDELKYDNYNGAWGQQSQLDEILRDYVIEAAQAKATEQGWQSEKLANGSLLITHPDGGTLTVSPQGQIDANGFSGCGCTEAGTTIASAIGSKAEMNLKNEYYETKSQVRVQE